MPLYHYECPKCGYEEVQFEKMEDRNKHKCPKCSAIMKQIFVKTPPIIYNSDGFYSTTFDRLAEPEKKVK